MEEFSCHQIRAIFWDVGGVLLTHAWDRTQREAALEHFKLDRRRVCGPATRWWFRRSNAARSGSTNTSIAPFSTEHDLSAGGVPEIYLLALATAGRGSQVCEGAGRFQEVSDGDDQQESRDLNLYRIERFGLRSIFSLFISSCFVGLRKPENDIYRLALDATQQVPEECCLH